MLNAALFWAVARLREPSTYAGIGLFVSGLTFLPGTDIAVATKVVGLLATVIPGVLAILLPEAGASK